MGYAGQPSAAYGYAAAPQTDSKAVVGLVLAIVSWVVCPVIPAIIALVLASQSNKAIAASNGRLEGHGMNTATKVISWINIVGWILGTIAMVVFFGFVVSQNPEILETPFPMDTQF